MTQSILTNARLVLADQVLHGSVVIDGARIVVANAGSSAVSGAIDMDGDFQASWICTPTIWSGRCNRAAMHAGRPARPCWRTMRNARPPA
jgi:hypothetical protein